MPDGIDLIREAAALPTMDELLARDPRTLTRADRLLMVEHFRQERARWLLAEDKKAAKKAEREMEKEAA
jgi:hypothetical protein